MINMYVILKMNGLTKEAITDLLTNNNLHYCGSEIDVTVNQNKSHVCIDYGVFAETMNEAIEGITYELTESNLIQYLTEMGVN